MNEELKQRYQELRKQCGRRGMPKEIIDAICADYRRLKSCSKVAALWDATRQGIWSILNARKMTCPRRLKEVRVEHDGMIFTPDDDGYLRATHNTGTLARKLLHRLIWEKAHGPIPPGHVMLFKDGDRTNVALDNLQCLPISQHSIITATGRNQHTIAREVRLMQEIERFILREAHRYAMAFGVEACDLAQIGRLRALRCAQTYREDGGAKFLTYAAKIVKSKMLLGAADLANITGAPRAKFMRGEVRSYSLEAPMSSQGDDERTLMDMIPAKTEEDVAPYMANGGAEALQAALGTLPEKTRRVVHLRFFEGKTLVETADLIGVSRTRIWQLERKALKDLRRHPEIATLMKAAA